MVATAQLLSASRKLLIGGLLAVASFVARAQLLAGPVVSGSTKSTGISGMVGLALVAVVLWAVTLPLLLGWLTVNMLRQRQPGYVVRLAPSLLLAGLTAWLGQWLLHLAWPDSRLGGLLGLGLPVAGALLGYYATRRPLPASSRVLPGLEPGEAAGR